MLFHIHTRDNFNIMLKELEKRIKRKQAEKERIEKNILDLRKDLATIDAVLAELESLTRMLPKVNGEETPNGSPARDIRFGTEVYHAREELQKAGKALYVGEILKRQGKDDSKGPRSSLASQLGTYAREGRIFTKEGPNTFGLLDYGERIEVDEPETLNNITPELPIEFAE